MKTPTLYLFAGLPGTGKSTLATRLATDLGAVYLSVDTIERGLREFCDFGVVGEGYRLAHRVAADNLRLGRGVVADSCNPVHETRRAWEDVAARFEAQVTHIEIVCSDAHEHRRRVEQRARSVSHRWVATWDGVQTLEYDPWEVPRLSVDTAGLSPDAAYAALCNALS